MSADPVAGEHSCSGSAHQGRLGWFPCANRGKIQEEDRWWCGIHAPSKVAARRRKSDDAEAARGRRQAELQALHEERARRLSGVLGTKIEARRLNYDTDPERIRWVYVVADPFTLVS